MKMFTKTFRLSPYTSFDNILRSASAYWGLMLSSFSVYQFLEHKDKPVDMSQMPIRVVHFLEAVA